MTRSRLLGSASASPSSSRWRLRPRPRRSTSAPDDLDGHRPRLGPRPRHVAVRRPGSGHAGRGLEADPRLLLPGHPAGPSPRPDQGAASPPTSRTSWSTPATGCGSAADRAARPSCLAKVRPRATRWRILPKGTRSVVPFKVPAAAAGQKWTSFPGAAEFTAGNQPMTLRLPQHEYRALPRRAALGREAHGQRAAARPLRAGRRPARGPGLVAGRGGPRPGGGGAHLCGVRARARDVVLRHLRHQLLPGLRRSRTPSTRPPTPR